MDPPILVLWQNWLLLNSGSGNEEEQVKEPDTQRKDLPDKKNLKNWCCWNPDSPGCWSDFLWDLLCIRSSRSGPGCWWSASTWKRGAVRWWGRLGFGWLVEWRRWSVARVWNWSGLPRILVGFGDLTHPQGSCGTRKHSLMELNTWIQVRKRETQSFSQRNWFHSSLFLKLTRGVYFIGLYKKSGFYIFPCGTNRMDLQIRCVESNPPHMAGQKLP